MKIKNYYGICSLLVVVALSSMFVASCSSDDEDDFGHHAKYSFVGKTYVYQWTLQNTTMDYQYVLHFSTDSTFTLTPIKVETGESMRDKPAEGMYVVKADGMLEFSGVASYLTKIRGQRITLYKGKFANNEQKVLKVYRHLEFNTGNSRTDWVDFHLK